MWKATRSVRTKLGIGLGLTLLLVAGLVGLSLWSIRHANQTTAELYERNVVGTAAIAKTKALLSGVQSDIKVALNSDAQSANLRDLPNEIKTVRTRTSAAWQRYYPALVGHGNERTAADKTQTTIQQIDKSLGRFAEAVTTQGALGAATTYGMSLRQPLEEVTAQLDQLTVFQTQAAERAFEDGQRVAHTSQLWLTGFGAAVLLITLLTLVWLVRMVMRPLNLARGFVESIAEGYLDVEVNHRYRDEFGAMIDAIAAMRDRLSQVVRRVRVHAQSVGAGAGEIASGNEELSARTQQQAANLEETAASMEQMTATVRQNADNAAQADQLARTVRDQAQTGRDVVAQAVASMQAIDAVSGRIADHVGLIDEIAFQTNLLALNASVEAARAGEQGRGFAVVASEVRNLATRSATAAKEINALVADSVDKVADGSRQVSRSGETLGGIHGSINQVSDVVAEIAAASKEQTGGIEQVNQAVSEMDGMTQQNTALVEESAAASRSLEEQARELSAEVAYFRSTDDPSIEHETVAGEATAPPAEAHRPTGRRHPQASDKARATPKTADAAPAEDDLDSDWATF